MAYDHTQNRKAEGGNNTDEDKALYSGGGRGKGAERSRGRGSGFSGRGGANQGEGRGTGQDKGSSGQKRGGGCYRFHEKEHQVRDCPYLGKHPPTEKAGGSPVQKRGKNSKKVKKCQDCREANGSDDSAYITLSLLNLDKRLTGLARDLQKELVTETGGRTVLLRGVRYVPELQCSLFSVERHASQTLAPEERIRCHYDEDDRADILMRDGQRAAHKDSTNLFRIDMTSPSDAMMVVGSDERYNVELWHDRLGHPGQNAFNALFRHVRWPMKSLDLRLPGGFNCSTCMNRKLTRKSFQSSKSGPSREWLRTHHDICGPYHVDSYSGKRYFGSFYDTSAVGKRSEIYKTFETYYEQVTTYLNVRMKELRCDNTKE
ncbi:LOW QUALITY PROTEIN: Integrase, catalytic core protein [Phytophthora megakarya]|uniref:Integrase, catalytic core protein n=1 Tax=Phytophthora megakarya TaxID=4795 RepID=A0A225WNU7_9STRA|nr:LOW QUALITY PROTEIN: Integrase, catalytic core protein [Phytophthora megakarya]